MKYIKLAKVFEELSSNNARLAKTAILGRFLQQINDADDNQIEYIMLLLQGRVFPEWDSRTVGLASKLVLRAISRATGYSEADVMKTYKEKGDIGETVEVLVGKKRQQTLFSAALSVQDVFATLQKLANLEGTKSQDTKLQELSRLLTSAQPLEAKFIARTVLEDLRVGIAEGTMRDAMAYAFFTNFEYDKENNTLNHEMKQPGMEIGEVKDKLKRAFDLTADYTTVLQHVRSGKSLDAFQLTLGTPCRVMLARKESSFGEAFARTGMPARVEYKYDGFRMQIHKQGEKVQLFTRRLEDVTTQFPDVVAAVKEHVTAKNCILDGEAVGYDPQTGKYQPFQHISKRIRRKYSIEELAKELPVELNIFDIIMKEGNILIDEPLDKRLEALQGVIKNEEALKIIQAKGENIKSEEEGQQIYEESLAAGNEGVMIKNLEGKYEPGGRVSAWIKLKPTMEDLDLVIVEAEWGSGKRGAWMTSFTLACRNEDDELLTIGKVGTGLKEKTDDEEVVTFAQLTELLQPLVTTEKGKEVIVRPEIVVTIAYEEIQKSPTYTSGFALRFPRVLRLRLDRSIHDIADMDDVIDFYEGQ